MPQRNINITQQQDQFIRDILDAGRFANVSEVFRAGLRLLEREERQARGDWLHDLAAPALDDDRRGQTLDMSTEEARRTVWDGVRAEALSTKASSPEEPS